MQGIPNELKVLNKWVTWKDPKTKKPYQVNGKSLASVTDPKTWGSFNTAIKTVEAGKAAGVGFVFSAEDDYCGFDLDDVFIKGVLIDEAEELVNMLKSYTELSVNGKGLHIICKCKEKLPAIVKKLFGLEFYSQNRYFVTTGNVFYAAGIEDRTTVIKLIHRKFSTPRTKAPVRKAVNPGLLKEVLTYIPAENYDDWLRVGIALKSIGADFEIWADWSKKSNKWNQDEGVKKWASFRDPQINFGSLIYMAKQHGYNDVLEQLKDTLPEAPKIEFSEGIECTDYANGLRAAKLFKDRYAYASGLGLREYNGACWIEGEINFDKRLVPDLQKQIYNEALYYKAEGAEKRATGLVKWSNGLGASNRAIAAKKFTLQQLRIPDSLFANPDPLLLPCGNGTVDLSTGLLSPNRASDYFQHCLQTPFIEGALAPRWIDFLEEIFSGDKDTIHYMQKLAGYCLTGFTYEEKCFFLCGEGSNGKSVFLNTLYSLLEGFGVVIHSSDLLENNYGDRSLVFGQLAGKRLAYAGETKTGKTLNTRIVKQITSTDPIQGRTLYKDPFTFKPSHKLILTTNRFPRVIDSDIGTWRRLVGIPFKNSFIKSADMTLQKKLRGELEGILAWAIEGALLWQKEELLAPPAIEQFTKVLHSEGDILGVFINEELIKNSVSSVSLSAVYNRYVSWCKTNNEYCLGRNTFSQDLKVRIENSLDRDKKVVFNGVKLNPLF